MGKEGTKRLIGGGELTTIVERQIGRQKLSIETGRIARQADGAALVRYGDTVVLATAVSSPGRADIDFFPLWVEYREMTYAAGKFPGGFIKREGRPSTKEITTMRLIDRPLRPLFPDGYRSEVQLMAVVLSADKQNDPDILGLVGASAALAMSSIPFTAPVGAVRVGRLDGQFVINPTHEELVNSDIDLVVAGTAEAVTMVEAGAKVVTEEDMLSAIEFGHEAVKQVVEMIDELTAKVGKPKQTFTVHEPEAELRTALERGYRGRIREACFIKGKTDRNAAAATIREDAVREFATPEEGGEGKYPRRDVLAVIQAIEADVVRKSVVEDAIRVDGRKTTEIRSLSMEVGVLPRTHGSALFTRGETQALVVATLGSAQDEQVIDGLLEEYSKRFMLHYNFPPFSVNEVKPVRGPSRRDIGHGALAERAVEPVVPVEEKFPYTIRIVSDIMESNGSSSMATVCGATLCLMDAGVPISDPVAGIAMGLIKEGDKFAVLTDIQGAEDHHGDMDFKVAGTQKGITALQMDVKVSGVGFDILRQGLAQARDARIELLRAMLRCIERPRASLSAHAPRLTRLVIDTEKIGALIGPGGRVIRGIQETTGSTIEVDDSGVVTISAPNEEAVTAARQQVEMLTQGVQVGKTYEGKVVGIKEFGAFEELVPGQDGLLHISEMSDRFVKNVNDVVKQGDVLKVKVIAVDDQGRVKLSRKGLGDKAPEGQEKA